MRPDDTWLVVDTETSGLTTPVHVVEIAAQRMRGWERDGEPFRALLNHDVPIEPMAEAVHGYSRQYLRSHGMPPRDAHAQFNDYAGDSPIVAYNISYDWDRALAPEYQRLSCPVSGRKGFCAMTLSRRTLCDVPNYKLETLKQHFGLNISRSHEGRNDVETLCALFEKVISARLFAAGLIGFDVITQFSRKTPVATCLEQIGGVGEAVWFFLGENSQANGPYTAAVIRSCLGDTGCYVWREGMTDWANSMDLPEFAPLVALKVRRKRSKKVVPIVTPEKHRFHADQSSYWMKELIEISKEILADGTVTEEEFYALHTWLMSCPCTHLYPFNMLAESVEMILMDGVVTADELDAFKYTLGEFLPEATDEIRIDETPQVNRGCSTSYHVVSLVQGTREWLKWRHAGIGASDAPSIMGENPWKSARQLLSEKRGAARQSQPNSAMARGTALEPEARRAFIKRSGIEVHPACLQSNQHEWLRASVDGISDDGSHIVEIKCGDSVYRRTMEEQCVPEYYQGQLQHILAITGLPAIEFFCFLPGRSEVLLRIERDDAYIDTLIRVEYDFWQEVLA